MGDADCSDPAAPVCDTSNSTCVQCVDDADCPSAGASRCDAAQHLCAPCSEDVHCTGVLGGDSGITPLGVCDVDECVQCTGLKPDGCAAGGPGGPARICDSLQKTCTNIAPNTADLCEACLSDAQCQTGQLCVLQTFQSQDVGFFCFPPDQGGICPGSGRPFVERLTQSTSIDNMQGSICGLADDTTCPALDDFREGTACSAATDCGENGLNDGLCSGAGGTSCTIPCGVGINCPVSAICQLGGFCE